MKQIALGGKNGVGKFALVSDEDFGRLSAYRWYLHKTGYVTRTTSCGHGANARTISIKMHIFVMHTPRKLATDHINHDKLDNRRENLRICTREQNLFNLLARGGNSKYKGVYYRQRNNRYHANIRCRNTFNFLGSFATEVEAAMAYNYAAALLFGEFASFNMFPEHEGLTNVPVLSPSIISDVAKRASRRKLRNVSS
jgi:hypothetical protein